MPRQARVVAVGVPHHITHRGNNRQDVFLSHEDRRRYQTLLFEQLAPCAVDLLGWCWMTNHVHLVAVPRRADSLARLVMRVHSAYAQQFNRRYVRTGHLWQSRFFSCALGPDRLQTALLYVDLNPVRAGLVGEATAYPGRARLLTSTAATATTCSPDRAWRNGAAAPTGLPSCGDQSMRRRAGGCAKRR